MKECDNSTRKIHISSNFILSTSLLIMLDTLLLRPSLHCNTPLLHFTTLQSIQNIQSISYTFSTWKMRSFKCKSRSSVRVVTVGGLTSYKQAGQYPKERLVDEKSAGFLYRNVGDVRLPVSKEFLSTPVNSAKCLHLCDCVHQLKQRQCKPY